MSRYCLNVPQGLTSIAHAGEGGTAEDVGTQTLNLQFAASIPQYPVGTGFVDATPAVTTRKKEGAPVPTIALLTACLWCCRSGSLGCLPP
jgi:hypothetical protein